MELRWVSSDYGRVKTLQYRNYQDNLKGYDCWNDVPTVQEPKEKTLEEKFNDYFESPRSATFSAMANQMAKIAEEFYRDKK